MAARACGFSALRAAGRWFAIAMQSSPNGARFRSRRSRATLAEVDEVLATLNEGTLLERRPSTQGEVTVLWAVLHAVEHFAMHTGQIITLTKLRTGLALTIES